MQPHKHAPAPAARTRSSFALPFHMIGRTGPTMSVNATHGGALSFTVKDIVRAPMSSLHSTSEPRGAVR